MSYENVRGKVIDLSYVKRHKNYEKSKEHFPNFEKLDTIDFTEYLEHPENFTHFTDQELAALLHGPAQKTLTNHQYERVFLRTLSERDISYEIGSGPNLKINLYQLAPAFVAILALFFLMLVGLVSALIPELDPVSATGWTAVALILPYLVFVGIWWKNSARTAFGVAWSTSRHYVGTA